jgi:hypothetical protein
MVVSRENGAKYKNTDTMCIKCRGFRVKVGSNYNNHYVSKS